MTHLKSTLAASFVAASLAFSSVAPAKADQAASTRNILLGAAAVAGIVIESNVARKHAQANNVAGYTQNGQTVYQDGSVAYQNGQRYYPGDNGQQVACSGQSCTITGNGAVGYDGRRYNGSGGYSGNVAYSGNPAYNGYSDNGRSRYSGRHDR